MVAVSLMIIAGAYKGVACRVSRCWRGLTSCVGGDARFRADDPTSSAILGSLPKSIFSAGWHKRQKCASRARREATGLRRQQRGGLTASAGRARRISASSMTASEKARRPPRRRPFRSFHRHRIAAQRHFNNASASDIAQSRPLSPWRDARFYSAALRSSSSR